MTKTFENPRQLLGAAISCFMSLIAFPVTALDLKPMTGEQQVAKQAVELLAASLGCAVKRPEYGSPGTHIFTYRSYGNDRTLKLEITDNFVSTISYVAITRYVAPFGSIKLESLDVPVINLGFSDQTGTSQESEPGDTKEEALKTLKAARASDGAQIEFCEKGMADDFAKAASILISSNNGRPSEEEEAWAQVSSRNDLMSVLAYLKNFPGTANYHTAEAELPALARNAKPDDIPDGILDTEDRGFHLLMPPRDKSGMIDVKSGPGTDFPSVGSFGKDEPLQAVGHYLQWVRLKSPGGVNGFVKRTQIIADSDVPDHNDSLANIQSVDELFDQAEATRGPLAKYTGVYASTPYCKPPLPLFETPGYYLNRKLVWFDGDVLLAASLLNPKKRWSSTKIFSEKGKFGGEPATIFTWKDEGVARTTRMGWTKSKLWIEDPGKANSFNPGPRCGGLEEMRKDAKKRWIEAIYAAFTEKAENDYK
jgi:hypothetical protein